MTAPDESLRARIERLRPLGPVAGVVGVLALLPFPTCLLKLVTGVPCPGCGMTRATLRLLRGDLHGSLAMHPVVAPGAVGLAVMVALALALPPGHPVWDRAVKASMTSLALGLVAVWSLRMAHLLPWV